MKTRYISGVVRDREAGLKGFPTGSDDFMPMGLGQSYATLLYIAILYCHLYNIYVCLVCHHTILYNTV